jgi:hypothetical protein
VYQARRGGMKVSAVFEYFEAPGSGDGVSSPRLERVVSHTTVRGAGSRSGRTILSSYDLLCVDPVMWADCVQRAGLVEIAVVDDERGEDVAPGRIDYAYRVLARPEHPVVRGAAGASVRRGAGRNRA